MATRPAQGSRPRDATATKIKNRDATKSPAAPAMDNAEFGARWTLDCCVDENGTLLPDTYHKQQELTVHHRSCPRHQMPGKQHGQIKHGGTPHVTTPKEDKHHTLKSQGGIARCQKINLRWTKVRVRTARTQVKPDPLTLLFIFLFPFSFSFFSF